MPARQRLTVEQRGRALALLDEGIVVRAVSRRLQVSHSVIIRLRDRHVATGSSQERPRSGRPRATTRQQDRHLRISALRDRATTASTLRGRLRTTTGVNVSCNTVRRRLREAGLRSRRPAVRPILSAINRTHRLALARQHVTWTRQQWGRVLFSDESRFILSFNDGRVRVWRRQGERYADATVREHNRYGGGSVMVWGGMSLGTRTPLLPIDGILNGIRYRDEVLRPVALPALAALGQGAILQDDKAPAHRARLVTNFLGQQNVNDDVACLLARPQPDRASVGCLGTAAQVQPRPACYPGQADPDPTGGVECHPPGNPSEPCAFDASSVSSMHPSPGRTHPLLKTFLINLTLSDFSKWGYPTLSACGVNDYCMNQISWLNLLNRKVE